MTTGGKPEKARRTSGMSPKEHEDYEAMVLLERLESLLEEMQELGIETRRELERQIEALHLRLSQDRQ